ncbi:ganglioside-induced differentiation-associated protein 1-like [Amphiura filiformis]|uniref:ganglioside-induced differentiation-associated protein 1-like n=1 Tax=Amphiura filiformis TaxID=82378 RepID=UPI003B2133CD
MALTLYYYPPSFYSQRACFALEEKGVTYHRHVISIHSGEGMKPWYMRIQPNGTVPALKHGEIMKTDSKDIIQYLDEIAPDAPKFYPDANTPGGDRVAYLSDLMHKIRIDLITYGSACYRHHTHDCKMPKKMNLEMAKSMVDKKQAEIRKLADENPDLRELYLAKLKVQTGRDLTNEEAFIAMLKECDSIMSQIENELVQKWKGKLDNFTVSDPWLCCNHFTAADIYLATLLHRLHYAGQVKRFWGDSKRPYLAAYYARVQERKSFQTACGSANNALSSIVLPKWKHRMRKAFPSLVGFSMVATTVGFAVYIRYKGFPSWWPNSLKIKS